MINYAIQACDAMETVMQLVAGGVLDRYPGAQVACIESGASWLAALAVVFNHFACWLTIESTMWMKAS